MLLYHGTNIIVDKPEIMQSGHTKDFGYGFYCTALEKQAQRWAISKRNPHIVCVYNYQPHERLKILSFETMTEQWLDFVVSCRHGEPHGYDVVEGPMADDQVWDYVEDFIAGRISREAFWALAKFKHPTHQVVFCNDSALRTLTFLSSYQL
ncbi:MAG: DUF3990 domain-containing protein [Bacteroidaceae bacterium]|nr:DUF3990 domain-containing protein [Bacteroidaceae bacterium]